ncbi:hypothetical protein [Nocardioides stalactiti]|uniref:hypothetical protein n=1 Tax=Nocardioides stalactiti TaxID=2755356 RepID=UPI0035E43DC5
MGRYRRTARGSTAVGPDSTAVGTDSTAVGTDSTQEGTDSAQEGTDSRVSCSRRTLASPCRGRSGGPRGSPRAP